MLDNNNRACVKEGMYVNNNNNKKKGIYLNKTTTTTTTDNDYNYFPVCSFSKSNISRI